MARRKDRNALGWTIAFLLSLALPGGAEGTTAALTPQVVWVPTAFHTGGAYTAIQAGPEGEVYLGTTVYDGFARLLVLPRGGSTFRLIADMGTVTGEASPGPYAQAKIHTKPAVAPDGRVYFGTKSGKRATDEHWQANYPGGHLLVYDPRFGRVTDLGIPRPRQSIIAVGVDPRRGLVYVLTDPEEHLVIYDPHTSAFVDKGELAQAPQPTRYLIVLGNGDVYHPAGPGAFSRYAAADDRIERVPLQFSGRGTYEVSRIGSGPYAMAVNLDGRRFHGVGEHSGEVYTFTPADRSLLVQFHGTALPADAAGQMTYYTMTSAPDGNIYYTATLQRGSRGGTLDILRLSTKTSRPELVGEVATLPPHPPEFSQRVGRLLVEGSTAGPDGTLYIMLAYPLRVLVFPKLAAP